MMPRTRVALLLSIALVASLLGPLPVLADDDGLDGVLISEMATRGPGAGTDNFVEITNYSDDPVDISGWSIERCNNTGSGFTGTQVAIDDFVLAPGDTYLVAHATGFTGGVTPDDTYGISIADNGGARILDAGGTVVDGIGFGDNANNCTQGAHLPPLTTAQGNDGLSYHRVDSTGDNASDYGLAPRDPQPNQHGSGAPPGDGLDGVLISETANGGPGGSFDNFIEITNFGDESVNVAGWEVYRCFGSGALAGSPQVPPFGDVDLAPGESILLAHEEFTGPEPDAQYFGFDSLANAGFGVLVQDAAGQVVDRFAAHTGNPGSPCADGDEFPTTITFAAAESFQRVAATGDNASDFEIGTRDPQALGRDLFPEPPAPEGVMISETANGGPGGGFDTFIELTNFSDEPADVTGWQVFRCFASGNLASTSQVPPFGEVVLAPGETILLAHEQFTGPTPDATYFGSNNLANAGFGVLVTDAAGATVDRFAATVSASSPCADGTPHPQSITFAAAQSYQRVGATGDNAVDFGIGSRDPQALGRDLFAGVPAPLPICEVMGPGLNSPFVDDVDPDELANLSEDSVTTTGIVYATQTTEDFNNGFWIQMADDDDSACPDGASRGIYVFIQSIRSDTPGMPGLGDEILVTAPVNEFFGESTQLQVNNPAGYEWGMWVTGTGNPLPEPVTIDAEAALAQDADQLYYASLHQQRVELAHGQSYVGTNKFGEAFLVPGTTTERIRRTDERYELLALAEAFLPGGGPVNMWAFDEVSGAVGPLDYSFGNYKLIVEDADAVTTTDNQQGRPHQIQAQPDGTLGFATWNIEDIFGDPAVIAAEEGIEVIAPSDLDEHGNVIAQPDQPGANVITPPLEERERRRDMIALAMVDHLSLPAVVGVQEIANETLLSQIATRINEELWVRGIEGHYEAVYVPGNDQRHIDVGYLVDVTRVSYGNVEKIDADAPANVTPDVAEETGECAQGPDGAFLHDRPPLRIDVTDLATGETFTMVTIHNKSRSGGTAQNEEFEPCRVEQTQSVVDYLAAQGLTSNVVIGGDINTFRESPSLAVYEDAGYVNLVGMVPEDRRFSYSFSGRVQFLDHLIVSPDLAERFVAVDSAKIVNDAPFPQEFEDGSTAMGSSDHDPIVGYLALQSTIELTFGDLPGMRNAGRTVPVAFEAVDADGEPVGASDLTVTLVHPDGTETSPVVHEPSPGSLLVLVVTNNAQPGSYTVKVTESGTGIGIGTLTFEATAAGGGPPP